MRILSLLLLISCAEPSAVTQSQDLSTQSASLKGSDVSVHTTLGLPDQASVTDMEHYLSVKAEYVISYNTTRKTPNWTSWELNTSYLGSQGRANDYRPDDTFPSSIPQAELSDYAGSGWQRGHLCPSADRTLDSTSNDDTFYLTNMVPQAPNNNMGPWEKLESYERTLARQGKELFIVAGGVYASDTTIGTGVAVPTAMFKVIVVLDNAGDPVTTSTRVIAVEMPNDDALIGRSDPWQNFIVSARQIETDTGLDFNADIPQRIQDVIEAEIDTGP